MESMEVGWTITRRLCTIYDQKVENYGKKQLLGSRILQEQLSGDISNWVVTLALDHFNWSSGASNISSDQAMD